ncbi:MAG: glycosyltransferase [Bacteroidetes bacterium]|nr:glycosyltransferase [Bacteroidota bacterium]
MWIYSLFVIFSLLAIWYIRLFFRYTRGWESISVTHKQEKYLPLSVIIPYRNEGGNLKRLFDSFDSQDYGNVTWIFVDDRSDDKGQELVQAWNPKVGTKISIEVPDNVIGKKAAINLGINKAETDWVLCTDADTFRGPNWLSVMAAAIDNEQVELVSGPVSIRPGNSWFSQWQCLEFSGLIAIGGAAIALGSPNMCNGANIMYRKSSFTRVGGFVGNEMVPGGDDQFLLHRLHKNSANSIRFCKNQEAIVFTDAVTELGSFIAQRVRWASKNGSFENRWVSIEMTMIWLYYFSILFCLSGILWNLQLALFGMVSFFLKTGIEYRFYRRTLAFFGESRLLKGFIFSEIVQLFYVVVIGLLGKFGNYKWKGREFRSLT